MTPEANPAIKVPAVIEITPYHKPDGILTVDKRIYPYWAGNGIAAIRFDLRVENYQKSIDPICAPLVTPLLEVCDFGWKSSKD